MLTLRNSEDRGHFDHGWLKTWHSFSFADYRDPKHTHHSVLRVINDDIIAPGQGFGSHPHQDMEILTWVLEGALTHKDNMGNSSVILPGEAQRMSAGSGVVHSEFNHSNEDPIRLLQIWIFPETKNIEPSYEQKAFPLDDQTPLTLIADRNGTSGAVTIHQDVSIWRGVLKSDQKISLPFVPGRKGWLQITSGDLTVGGQELHRGDGLAITDEGPLEAKGIGASEFLMFDLP